MITRIKLGMPIHIYSLNKSTNRRKISSHNKFCTRGFKAFANGCLCLYFFLFCDDLRASHNFFEKGKSIISFNEVAIFHFVEPKLWPFHKIHSFHKNYSKFKTSAINKLQQNDFIWFQHCIHFAQCTLTDNARKFTPLPQSHPVAFAGFG